MGQILDRSGPLGARFAIAATEEDGVVHGVVGCGTLTTGRQALPAAGSFGVAWISTRRADKLSLAQIIAGYGRVMFCHVAADLQPYSDRTPSSALRVDLGSDPLRAVNAVGAIGRSVVTASAAGDFGGVSLVSWIDTAGRVQGRFYGLDTGEVALAPLSVMGVDLDRMGTAATASGLTAVATVAGFVVAWTDPDGRILAQEFCRITKASFFASPLVLMDSIDELSVGPTGTGAFALEPLPDAGGFTLSVLVNRDGGVSSRVNKSYLYMPKSGCGRSPWSRTSRTICSSFSIRS